MFTTRILYFLRIFNISNGNSDKESDQTVQSAIILVFISKCEEKKKRNKTQKLNLYENDIGT